MPKTIYEPAIQALVDQKKRLDESAEKNLKMIQEAKEDVRGSIELINQSREKTDQIVLEAEKNHEDLVKIEETNISQKEGVISNLEALVESYPKQQEEINNTIDHLKGLQ